MPENEKDLSVREALKGASARRSKMKTPEAESDVGSPLNEEKSGNDLDMPLWAVQFMKQFSVNKTDSEPPVWAKDLMAKFEAVEAQLAVIKAQFDELMGVEPENDDTIDDTVDQDVREDVVPELSVEFAMADPVEIEQDVKQKPLSKGHAQEVKKEVKEEKKVSVRKKSLADPKEIEAKKEAKRLEAAKEAAAAAAAAKAKRDVIPLSPAMAAYIPRRVPDDVSLQDTPEKEEELQ